MDPTIIGGGLQLLGSLFGRKQKRMTPADSIISTARGVTSAAQETGLNRLTLLQASNATAGAGMAVGSPPPLASLSVLGGLIEDNWGEDAKQRKEYNRLQNELLTLEVERARTLSKVAMEPSVAAGGAITGGRVQTRISGPANGFLQETDRNPASADERDNTVSYQSHGEETVVPVGPDRDEILSGLLIDAYNRSKAAKARMAMGPMDYGKPLKKPWAGLFFNRMHEVMPPRKPKNHLVPDDWYRQQFN